MTHKTGVSASIRCLSRRQIILYLAGFAFLLYTAFGFLIAPQVLKQILEGKLPEILNRPVTIEKINLNPFALSATVYGFKLGRKVRANSQIKGGISSKNEGTLRQRPLSIREVSLVI
ncbi:MAG: hypothetical protein KJ950_12885 [Proteobacteria bacterium]|nr:hypothetical protein [Pseudomonadota bacterium]MBU1687788.1 hypothetical protein [Pseudomonadota bacterium]